MCVCAVYVVCVQRMDACMLHECICVSSHVYLHVKFISMYRSSQHLSQSVWDHCSALCDTLMKTVEQTCHRANQVCTVYVGILSVQYVILLSLTLPFSHSLSPILSLVSSPSPLFSPLLLPLLLSLLLLSPPPLPPPPLPPPLPLLPSPSPLTPSLLSFSQWFLLKDMLNTRRCSHLLLSELPSDTWMEEVAKQVPSDDHFKPQQFQCQLVWRRHILPHWRLKVSKGESPTLSTFSFPPLSPLLSSFPPLSDLPFSDSVCSHGSFVHLPSANPSLLLPPTNPSLQLKLRSTSHAQYSVPSLW